MTEDRIYRLPFNQVGKFEFDEQVVRVFPDMIARSVPGYGSILSMIGELAARYAQADTNLYDLGCSLGAASFVMRAHVPESCQIEAIDSSAAMVEKFQQLLAEQPPAGCRIAVHQADIREVSVTNASFAVLNFTLQFLPAEERAGLLAGIYQGMLPHAALVLSEKICFAEESQQTLLTDLHHAFKRAHGYSELEIAQKRTALENRLIPETLDAHMQRLQEIGFSTVAAWFQCLNFVSILAVK